MAQELRCVSSPAQSSPRICFSYQPAGFQTSAVALISRPWHFERTNAWHNAFNRFQRCYERHEKVIDTFFDLADTIITVHSLIRRGLDHPPLGHPTYPTIVINTSIRATSKARR